MIKILRTLLLLTFVFLMTDCTDKENPFNYEEIIDKSKVFNFSTEELVTLNINLGKLTAKQVVCLYPSIVDPVTAHSRGDMLFSCYLDENGKANAQVKLPPFMKNLYAYSPTNPSIGTFEMTVNGNVAQVKESSVAFGIVDDDLQLFDITDYIHVDPDAKMTPYNYSTVSTLKKADAGKYYCINDWHPTLGYVDGVPETTYHYGGFTDVNGLKSRHSTVSDDATALFEQFKAAPKNPSAFTEQDINIVLEPRAPIVEKDDLGNIVKTKTFVGAQLYVVFLDENAGYTSPFGYYIYDNDKEPTTLAAGWALDHYLIFPSASVPNKDPFWRSTIQEYKPSGPNTGRWNQHWIYSGFAPLRAGDRMQLLYHKNGEISRMFPVGSTVGFWLQPDGYDNGWDNNHAANLWSMNIDYDRESMLVFTQNANTIIPDRSGGVNSYMVNSNPKITYGGKTRYAFYDTEHYGEKIRIYGIEDGVDNNYTDITFVLERIDQFKTEIDGEEVYEEDWHIVATYAFEDIWPDGGDYDLNDVVVEHWVQKVYNENNELVCVNDRFDITPDTKAGNHNALFVSMPIEQLGDVSKLVVDGRTGSNAFESETNSAKIFFSQRDQISMGKRSIIMSRNLKGSGLKVTENLDYDPYLIPNSKDLIGEGRTEIHLPLYAATPLSLSLVEKGDFDHGFYANRFLSDQGNFPFAIMLSKVSGWHASDETKRIDETFTHYLEWVQSKGTNHTDWYLNKSGYDVRY